MNECTPNTDSFNALHFQIATYNLQLKLFNQTFALSRTLD